jgi:hypothetical protein
MLAEQPPTCIAARCSGDEFIIARRNGIMAAVNLAEHSRRHRAPELSARGGSILSEALNLRGPVRSASPRCVATCART